MGGGRLALMGGGGGGPGGESVASIGLKGKFLFAGTHVMGVFDGDCSLGRGG